jgi:putative ABC transport system permease protein
MSYPAFRDLQAHATSFESVSAFMRNGVRLGGREPRSIDAALISSNLWPTLRVPLMAGRNFSVEEDAPGGAPVLIISNRLAVERFGAAANAPGQTLSIDGAAHTIVGVVANAIPFPDREVDVWMPLGPFGTQPFMGYRSVHATLVTARLREGATIDTARAELEAWMDAQHARDPKGDPGHRILVQSLAALVTARSRSIVAALMGAVALLLAVTCSSVGMLLLTRGSGRATEVAIRLSLGASRARLTRQFLTETACVALIGAGAGIAGAHALLVYLVRGLATSLPPFVVPTVSGVALAAALVAAALATILCGVAPAAAALQFVRGPATAVDRRRHRLLIAQVAVSCVLVVPAVILGRSLDRLFRVDPGFRVDRLAMMQVSLPPNGYNAPGAVPRFFETAVARVRALPGVAAATAGAPAPFSSGGVGNFHAEGVSDTGGAVATFRRIQPGYFGALGIPLLAGRDFATNDGAGDPIVIVNQGLARRFWLSADAALGKRIKIGVAEREPWLRIVGVVGDVRNRSLEVAPELATYEPHRQRPRNGLFIMARTEADSAAMAPAIQRAIRELEPDAVIAQPQTMEERLAATFAARRFYTVIVGAFAAATLLLVALAIYGAMSYSVNARFREIGVRAAVGASAATLKRFILGEALRPAAIGLAAGLAGGAMAAFAARGLLYEIGPFDAASYAAVSALFFLLVAVASWRPATRAARIDPTVALRAD